MLAVVGAEAEAGAEAAAEVVRNWGSRALRRHSTGD